MSANRWTQYVNQHRRGESDTEVGAKVGVTGSSVGRWDRSAPKVESVAQFAQAYGRPVLEAFVAAGFLTSHQAAEQLITPDLATLTHDELANEMLARMRRGDEVSDSPQPAGLDRRNAALRRAIQGTFSERGAAQSDDGVDADAIRTAGEQHGASHTKKLAKPLDRPRKQDRPKT